VYFLLNLQQPPSTSQNGQSVWTGGGALPADPLWLVPAADGGSYLAGNDGSVYSVRELPQ
jgi:hypothetical protein